MKLLEPQLPSGGDKGAAGVATQVGKDAAGVAYAVVLVVVVGTVLAIGYRAAKSRWFPNAPGPGSLITDRFGTPVGG